jgi:hypothetical protein
MPRRQGGDTLGFALSASLRETQSSLRFQESGFAEFAFWRQAASSGRDHVCATVEKTKRGASEKFFIPSGARSYAIFGRRAGTEFRHDSCNAAHR